MSVKVAITELEYGKAAEYLRSLPDFEFIVSPPGEEELAAVIREHGARHAVVGVRKYVGALYRALPPGGVIARFGVGYDGIDRQAAAECGLFCTNTPGVLERSVAEFSVGSMITAARHLSLCAAEVRAGAWHNRVGVELAGKRLLIVGCGRIGRQTARIAALGFDMRVTGFNRTGENPDPSLFETVTADFGEAVADADFISLHIPSSSGNFHFINAARLRLMKPSAILINTARGSVVDENALYDAVAAGTIAGAALDVFAHEPYCPVDPARDLRRLDRVILTPHLGSSTAEACLRVARRVVANLRAAERGDRDQLDLI